MAVPLEQFVKQLEASGILDGDTLKGFIPPNAAPKDAQELARELVRKKKLTKFQAEVVYRGRSKLLVLGNYVLMEKIGAGGMGEVFKAEHRRMKRVVAVKLLPAAMTKNKAAIARFEREVEAAAKISHPNIVAAYDADQANGVRFLVMELVDGGDLSALIKKNGPLPIEKAVHYILQAAKGLEAAHAAGIVHRDIKPSNLLLDNKGIVKILDMGLARLSGSPTAAELTSSGTVMGTVDYMAPEQALDSKTADARADIYSLGCSLFYLLTGKTAYDGDTLTAKLLAHRQEPIPSLRAARPEAPGQIEAIFSKMVAKRVEDRFQSMSEVVTELESALSGGLATTVNIERLRSTEERKTLSRPLAPLVQVVASEQSKHLLAKIIGGAFATIIAPILVTLVIKRMDNDNPPPKPSTTAAAPSVVDPADDPNRGAAEWVIGKGGTPAKPIAKPEFQQWLNNVAALPAQKQVEAVTIKLRELNPNFVGKVTPKIQNDVVTDLSFVTNRVHNIFPVRALKGLRVLRIHPNNSDKKSRLFNLTPLRGLPLTQLDCSSTEVSDLSPLHDCKSLKSLNARNTNVTSAGVAALKKALPDCKIEWDDPAKAWP